MITTFYLIGVVLLILTNTFFVAVEFAMVTVSESFLKIKSQEGDKRAIASQKALDKLPRYLAGAQLGITISTLALGFLVERLFDLYPLFSYAIATAFALFVVTFLQMVIGEIVPKNISLSDPDKTALFLARPHFWFVKILSPIIWVIDKVTAFGVRLLGVDSSSEENQARTPVELLGVVEESLGEGVIDKFDHDLLTGALDLGKQTVGRNMTLRPRIISVAKNSTVREVEEAALSSGHSRLPISSEAKKDIVGYVHANDLLGVAEDERDEKVPQKLIRSTLELEVDCPLDEALVSMQRERRHLAIVLDKRSNVLGLITIEDVLESLVGDFPED